MGVLLPLPLGEVDLRSKDGEAHAVSFDAKASDAIRNFAATAEAVPLGKVAANEVSRRKGCTPGSR